LPGHDEKSDFKPWSRVTLLALQVLVAVAGLAPMATAGRPCRSSAARGLPPFLLFPIPSIVGGQIVDWFASGVIWKHLFDHACGSRFSPS